MHCRAVDANDADNTHAKTGAIGSETSSIDKQQTEQEGADSSLLNSLRAKLTPLTRKASGVALLVWSCAQSWSAPLVTASFWQSVWSSVCSYSYSAYENLLYAITQNFDWSVVRKRWRRRAMRVIKAIGETSLNLLISLEENTIGTTHMRQMAEADRARQRSRSSNAAASTSQADLFRLPGSRNHFLSFLSSFSLFPSCLLFILLDSKADALLLADSHFSAVLLCSACLCALLIRG